MSIINFKTNIAATLLSVPYIILISLFTPNNEYETCLIDDFLLSLTDIQQGVVIFIIICVTIPVWMYTFRYLYNRIIPTLYGVREINLSESYALALLICTLLIS